MAISIATSGCLWNTRGTGHNLIREPLPAAPLAVEPQNGLGSRERWGELRVVIPCERWNLLRDWRVVIPISKHSPVLDKCPSFQKKKSGSQSEWFIFFANTLPDTISNISSFGL